MIGKEAAITMAGNVLIAVSTAVGTALLTYFLVDRFSVDQTIKQTDLLAIQQALAEINLKVAAVKADMELQEKRLALSSDAASLIASLYPVIEISPPDVARDDDRNYRFYLQYKNTGKYMIGDVRTDLRVSKVNCTSGDCLLTLGEDYSLKAGGLRIINARLAAPSMAPNTTSQHVYDIEFSKNPPSVFVINVSIDVSLDAATLDVIKAISPDVVSKADPSKITSRQYSWSRIVRQ